MNSDVRKLQRRLLKGLAGGLSSCIVVFGLSCVSAPPAERPLTTGEQARVDSLVRYLDVSESGVSRGRSSLVASSAVEATGTTSPALNPAEQAECKKRAISAIQGRPSPLRDSAGFVDSHPYTTGDPAPKDRTAFAVESERACSQLGVVHTPVHVEPVNPGN